MKKISVKTVKAFMDSVADDVADEIVCSVGDASFTVHLKTKLTVEEKGQFIRRVVDSCFGADGSYHPQYFVPMVRATMIQMCTDLPALSLRSEDGDLLDVDGMNDLYMAMDFDDVNLRPAFRTLFLDMTGLCEHAVEYERGMCIASANAASDQALTEVAGAMKSIRDAAAAIAKQVNGADTAKLLEYAGKLSQATDSMAPNRLVEELVKHSAESQTASNVVPFPGRDTRE